MEIDARELSNYYRVSFIILRVMSLPANLYYPATLSALHIANCLRTHAALLRISPPTFAAQRLAAWLHDANQQNKVSLHVRPCLRPLRLETDDFDWVVNGLKRLLVNDMDETEQSLRVFDDYLMSMIHTINFMVPSSSPIHHTTITVDAAKRHSKSWSLYVALTRDDVQTFLNWRWMENQVFFVIAVIYNAPKPLPLIPKRLLPLHFPSISNQFRPDLNIQTFRPTRASLPYSPLPYLHRMRWTLVITRHS
ncbi:hypothetical protein BC936DRAFT_139324 [Jimgerdemannia flammicorona]|uniref:Uncharacterized protein n=1 Tax=Jimgerdemannia flammicorona TaxID=994334 RepID=A0A433BAA2_9FUNG|nr:hypothetical protein BC936DRAFT_139324 [Jimgerdemannia flammicorona]